MLRQKPPGRRQERLEMVKFEKCHSAASELVKRIDVGVVGE